MRVVRLSQPFQRARRVYAPHGSPENVALGRVLAQLGAEDAVLPGPKDEEAFRTPLHIIWARPIPSTPLLLMYTFTPPVLDVLSLRRATW